MERRRFVFHGRVQGVGFRYTSARLAQRFPLTGWVQNLPDGTVELEVQGEPSVITAYLAQLQEHFAGNISRVDSTISDCVPHETGFSILR